jgi:hypothetical protein
MCRLLPRAAGQHSFVGIVGTLLGRGTLKIVLRRPQARARERSGGRSSRAVDAQQLMRII